MFDPVAKMAEAEPRVREGKPQTPTKPRKNNEVGPKPAVVQNIPSPSVTVTVTEPPAADPVPPEPSATIAESSVADAVPQVAPAGSAPVAESSVAGPVHQADPAPSATIAESSVATAVPQGAPALSITVAGSSVANTVPQVTEVEPNGWRGMPQLGRYPSLSPCVLPWSRRPRLSMEEARERMLRCYRPTMRGGNFIWDTDGVRRSATPSSAGVVVVQLSRVCPPPTVAHPDQVSIGGPGTSRGSYGLFYDDGQGWDEEGSLSGAGDSQELQHLRCSTIPGIPGLPVKAAPGCPPVVRKRRRRPLCPFQGRQLDARVVSGFWDHDYPKLAKAGVGEVVLNAVALFVTAAGIWGLFG